MRTANTYNYLSIRIPRQKVLHYSFDAQGKFGNPYGRSLLRRAYKYYVMKDAFLQMMSVALDRKGTPLTLIFADPNTTLIDPDKKGDTSARGRRVGIRADDRRKERVLPVVGVRHAVLERETADVDDRRQARHRNRDLRDDQDGPRPSQAKPVGAARLLERVLRSSSGRMQRWKHAGHDRSEESEHGDVHVSGDRHSRIDEVRQCTVAVRFKDRDALRDPESGQCNAGDRWNRAQYQRFDEQLSDDAPAAGADCRANGDFALARRGPGIHKHAHIHRDDDRQEAHHRLDHGDFEYRTDLDVED